MFRVEGSRALLLVVLIHCARASINATNTLTDNWHADSISPRYESTLPSSDYYLKEILKQLALLNKKFDRMMIRMIGSTVRHEDYDDRSLKRPEANVTQPDCESLMGSDRPSGIYNFDASIRKDIGWVWNVYAIYCDQSAGGGWTVIQRRGGSSPRIVNFTKTWDDYAKGFGDLEGEFWLGNEWIHRLTTFFGPYELRMELKGSDDITQWAQYSEFTIGSKEENYQILIGGYTGNGTDPLHRGSTHFSTYDRNNDIADPKTSCTSPIIVGWWYFSQCDRMNPNSYNVDIKSVKMMIRLKRYHQSMP